MLSWSTALSVTLPSAIEGLIGEPGGELAMLQLVCGRLNAGADAGSPRGAVCARLGDVAGDQGRWNYLSGRFWKGLGKRSGVEIMTLKDFCGGSRGGVEGWPTTWDMEDVSKPKDVSKSGRQTAGGYKPSEYESTSSSFSSEGQNSDHTCLEPMERDRRSDFLDCLGGMSWAEQDLPPCRRVRS